MARPTFIQRVLGRPSQRYSTTATSDFEDPSEEPALVCSHSLSPPPIVAPARPSIRPLEDTDEPFFTPTSSPFHSAPNSPTTTPPTSAASSALSLSDVHPSDPPKKSRRKLTYTDEDWARDVRWLVAPRTGDHKHKSKQAKRRSAPPSIHIPTSRSTPFLPSRLPPPLPHHPSPRSSKSKGIGKAKISTARSVVGMSALLEVEEDLDPDLSLSYAHDTPIQQRRSSVSRSPERPSNTYHKPRVSSPLRSTKLSRQRSFSSPPLMLVGDQTPGPSSMDPSHAPRRALSPTSRSFNTASQTVPSTSKSPYTSPASNVLDALAAHVTSSDSHDTLPSTGTRGYTSLVLPHAVTTPSLALENGSHRVWKIGNARPTGTTVRDTIGIGLGLGDQVDLSRARLAQTTMASVEIVRGIAATSGVNRRSHVSRGSVFGMSWFSKDKTSAAPNKKNHHSDTDSPLGFTVYRTPPVYVSAGSVLVQVWGVGLDGIDARLTGIHHPLAGSSLPSAPYGNRTSKVTEKDRGRSPPVGYIPGRSFVGRVLEVGWEVGVDVAKRGDWVIGLMPVNKCGALAEFILADRHRIHRISNPFAHLKYPSTSVYPTDATIETDGNVSMQQDSPPLRVEDGPTINELALLPLCGVPAYRAVRTFHPITHHLGKSQLPYGNSHNELHPILPPRSDIHDFNACGDYEDVAAQVRLCDSRPRALLLRAHDGAGALAAQMLVREGWAVWAHVPVPFMLPGTHSELPDELKDEEEEEKELDNQRRILRRIEDRLRGWGVDEVIFVPVTSMPLSASFDVSNTALEAMSSWSSPSTHFPRSPSSSPSISPSPFSRSTTSTPLSSPYSYGLSSSHLSSSLSSSSHQNAFTAPYSFAPLPLTPYNTEQGSIVSLMSYLTRSRVRLDAILDTIGGREIWDAGRLLLSRPVRDLARQDLDAQFTTLVGDTPDRVVSTAGDNFRAGVRALRLGGGKDQHPPEDSGYHGSMGKEKKAKAKPRPVNYSWVNVVSDIDWEGSDIHDTLCAVMRVAMEGVKPLVGPPDFVSGGRGKGKKRAAEGIEEDLLGKVLPFESTPDAFVAGGGLEYGGTVVSRVAA